VSVRRRTNDPQADETEYAMSAPSSAPLARKQVGDEAARGQPITIGCFVRYRAEGRLLSYALAGNTGVVHWRDPSMPDSRDPQQNHLLAALSPAERERIYPHLRLVPMPLGEVLYESGDVLRHVYFPVDSIVSLLYVLADGASAEISVVGNEGLIGIALFMGGETTPSRAIVQSAGHAYRLIGQRLKDEFHRNGELQILLLRYTQALITQMAQTAVCNRHHSVDQQLCRWLLLSLDRLSSSRLVMTQELIANMLGVRREGVTEAAGKLHKLGVIRYARGQITVLDRPQLEKLCCECYAVVKKESDRLLPRKMLE
jgi:CRP-like cAMP-binding protein